MIVIRGAGGGVRRNWSRAARDGGTRPEAGPSSGPPGAGKGRVRRAARVLTRAPLAIFSEPRGARGSQSAVPSDAAGGSGRAGRHGLPNARVPEHKQ